jgi:hypothetical protein
MIDLQKVVDGDHIDPVSSNRFPKDQPSDTTESVYSYFQI